MKIRLIPAVIFIIFLFSIISSGFAQNTNRENAQPEQGNIEALKRAVNPFMAMSIKEVIAEVPSASGIYFIGCPNCNGGAQEMGVLNWEPGMGDKVKCKFCKMEFPNERFPNNKEKVIIAPSGAKQVYRYYQNAEGREYYYEPHAWYERWKWIQQAAYQLSQLWVHTGNNEYGDRAAAITGRFAQVFPDYAVRYDYPNAPVKFFPANQKWPYAGLVPYRGAKWSWWGYADIPIQLANVYTNLQRGYDWKRMDAVIGKETDKRIAKDLLRLGYEFTAANTEVYTNMSPGMYRDMIKVGIVLKDPAMVHDGVKRFREFVQLGFFADGWWKEGTGSYHDQTIGGLRSVVNAAKGYSDPIDWKGERFDNLDLTATIPFYKKALDVSREAILPDGRKIPINDTWANKGAREKPTEQTVSRLWSSLGNASLGAGKGANQTMLNINWSGNYGHSHFDNGSIILYAKGGEMLSDIGYTHSKYRGWTINTASHNTVVIDQKGQDAGNWDKPVTGRLTFYDDTDEHVKAIDVDASPAYAVADTYRRRLIVVHAAEGHDYIIDRFDVKGGKEHDWFLHGMCEEEGTLETTLSLDRKVETLVPAWGGNNMPKTQYDTNEKNFHPYTYLSNIQTGNTDKPFAATWKYKNSGLRTHNLVETGTQVFRFRSPSVRLANEDDNKLPDFLRNGLMLRHTGGNSTFVAVHEPFGDKPWIESIIRNGDEIKVRYVLDGKLVEDQIRINGNEIQVKSGAGWEYQSGKPRTGTVEGLETINGKFVLKLDKPISKTRYIRIDLAGGDTRYYPVLNIQGNLAELDGDPGFTMQGDGIKFHAFPNGGYKCKVGYTVFE
ncbi:MAG TPA: heparinase II/III family protein [Sphingobacteriaceae bacterium]